jgi:hypothetical protein
MQLVTLEICGNEERGEEDHHLGSNVGIPNVTGEVTQLTAGSDY